MLMGRLLNGKTYPCVEFVEAGERGEGIDGVDLVATDRARCGETHNICGVTFRLV